MKSSTTTFASAIRGPSLVRTAARACRSSAGLPHSSRASCPARTLEVDGMLSTKRERVSSFPFLSNYLTSRSDVQTPRRQSSWRAWQLQDQKFYSKEVHEHFFNPRNAGAFDLSDPDVKKKVGTAVVGKAACGDVIKLQVMVEDGKIKDARFKTFGCGSAIASSSYATEMIKGKSCEAALQLKNTDIAEYLNLPPVKVHCSLLAEDAVRNAIKDYQKRQQTGSTMTSTTATTTTADAASVAASAAVAASAGKAAEKKVVN